MSDLLSFINVILYDIDEVLEEGYCYLRGLVKKHFIRLCLDTCERLDLIRNVELLVMRKSRELLFEKLYHFPLLLILLKYSEGARVQLLNFGEKSIDILGSRNFCSFHVNEFFTCFS